METFDALLIENTNAHLSLSVLFHHYRIFKASAEGALVCIGGCFAHIALNLCELVVLAVLFVLKLVIGQFATLSRSTVGLD